MSRNTLTVLLLALAVFPVLPPAQAQETMQWHMDNGTQYLETDGNTLHLLPRTNGTGPRTVKAAAKLSLPDTQKWQVSFDIRFGVLKDMASSFHFMQGDRNIGWVGADGVHKVIGIFAGKDSEVSAPPADKEWHHFTYAFDGSALTISQDGKLVTSVPEQNENIHGIGTPNNLYVDNGQDLSQPSTQTGVWVRNMQVSADAADNKPALAAPQASPPQAQLQKTINQQNALIAALKQQIASKRKPVRTASRHVKPHRIALAKRKTHAPAPAPSIVFFDDFSDSRRTSMQWQETFNGGDIAFTGNSLRLNGNGTGCPRLTTHNSPFPATGNWTATFAFRYTRIAPYGTTIGLGKAGGDYVACVHQDQTNQYLQMNGKNLAVCHADTDWHVVSFVKEAGTLALYLDGAKVGADTVQDAPVALQFGGGHVDNPGDWNDQEVQFMRVDRNEKVLDKMALLKTMPLTVATIQTNKQPPLIDPSVQRLTIAVDNYNHILLQVRALMRHGDMMGEEGRRGSAWLGANPYADYELREAVGEKAMSFLQQGLDDLNNMRPLLIEAINNYSNIKNDPNLFAYYQNGDFCTTASYIDSDLGMLGADSLRFLVRVRQ